MHEAFLLVLAYIVAICAGVTFQVIFRPPRFFHWRTSGGLLCVVILIYYSIGLGTHPVVDPVELLGPWLVYGSVTLAVVSGLVFTALHPFDDERSENQH